MRDLPKQEGQRPAMPDAAADLLAEKRFHDRLDRALARQPEVQLPENFAARVAAELAPGQQAPAKATTHFGQTVLVCCGAVLAVILLVLLVAGHGQQPQWLSSLLSVELALLALGAGPWRRVLRWPA